MRVRRAHDRGNHRGQQQPTHDRVEEHLRRHEIDALGIGRHVVQPACLRKRRQGNQPQQQRKQIDEEHPRGADGAALRNLGLAFHGHEPLHHALRAQVAQSPSHRREQKDHAEGIARPVSEGIPEPGRRLAQALERGVRHDNQPQRHDDEGRQHQRRLEHVGPRNRQEAADEGVGPHGSERHHYPQRLIQSEDRPQQLGTRDQAGTEVKDDEEEGNERRHRAHGPGGVPEPLFQKLRQGEGILRGNGVAAQPFCEHRPTGPDARHQCQGRPRLHQPVLEGQRREHQNRPTAGAGRTGAERRRETAHPPAPKHVIGHHPHPPAAENGNADQRRKIPEKDDQYPRTVHERTGSFLTSGNAWLIDTGKLSDQTRKAWPPAKTGTLGDTRGRYLETITIYAGTVSNSSPCLRGRVHSGSRSAIAAAGTLPSSFGSSL